MSSYEKNSFMKPSVPSPPNYHAGVPPTATGVPVSSESHFYSSMPPPPLSIQAPAPGPFSTGLCDCLDDVSNCCITCWCPCITFGRMAEIIDRGSTSCGVSGALYTLILFVTGCSCIYSCFYRAKLRRQYALHETPCNDFLVHCCCESCALCQEYRELKHRGFDMTMGWHGNVEKQTPGIQMVQPTTETGMSR
ncbi:protein PLANT CADMIUM RESISTANCE 2-like [Aristolochia californica]|uniref:protein PLANT CADMIUM RESISTANCE 2-like n=1 Tax=Aristolochia californica TaxID=171875 RepID=UPI0035E0A13B